VLNLIDIN